MHYEMQCFISFSRSRHEPLCGGRTLWCTGCNTCLAACSDVHKTQGLQQHPRLALAKTSTLTAPVVCHHCEEAPCVQVCPVNAISQRDDAIQLNESLCIGCKLCAVVCPFGAISASGSRPVNAPAQYVFQAEGSLKDGEEKRANTTCFAALGTGCPDRRGEMRPV